MYTILSRLLNHLDSALASDANIIPWGCPVPSFGDPSRSQVATLGLNPSNREFVDERGKELQGTSRRFHTLRSLGLGSWAEVDVRHLRMILASCTSYFIGSPYDRWFRVLDRVISGTKASYYGDSHGACHLDLIPYATACKWTELTPEQRLILVAATGNTLGLLLRDSPIKVLILNGKTVVEQFQNVAGVRLDSKEMPAWSLPRQSKSDVTGIAYMGVVETISGIPLGREVLILGYNHNLQSSFGVTTEIIYAIRGWITEVTRGIV